MNPFAGIGAILGGGLAGYKLNDDMERQKKDDAYKDEVRSRQRKDWADDDAYKTDMKAAAAPAQALATPLPQVDDEGTPNAAALQAPSYSVGQTQYMSKPDADNAAGMQNASSTKYARMAQVAESHGQIERAAQLHGLADKYKAEGATDFIGGISAIRPDMAGLQAAGGTVRSDIPDALKTNFNATGSMKIPAGAQVEHFINKHSDGSQFADSRVIDKDGKPLVQSLAAAEGMMLMSAHERQQDALKRQEMANTSGYQSRMAGVAETNADTNAGYRNDQARHNQVLEGLEQQKLGILRDKAGAAASGAGAAPAEYDFTGEAAKITEEAAKAAATAGTPWSPKQTAQYRMDLQNEMQGQHRNTLLMNAGTRALTATQGTPDYATTYQKLVGAGMTPDTLKARGFAPPPGFEPVKVEAAPVKNGTVSDLIDSVASHFKASDKPADKAVSRPPPSMTGRGSSSRDPVTTFMGTPSPRAGIGEKVKAAAAGSYKLSPQETALARQQGLI